MDYAGKLRTYIELSLDDFLKIKHYDNIITHYFKHVRQPESIFRHEDFIATVVPPNHPGQRAALKLSKNGSRVYIYEETFRNMMTYEDTLRKEYAECQRRNDDDRRFLDDLANIMAFRRNAEKANDFVGESAEWFQGGTVPTWNRFVEQVSKSKERLRKRTRTSDKMTR